MMKSKKLMTAALAVAALATASIASVGDAQGARRAWWRLPRRLPRRREVLRWRTALRPPLARSPPPSYGYAYNTCWKYTPNGLVNVCKVLPY